MAGTAKLKSPGAGYHIFSGETVASDTTITLPAQAGKMGVIPSALSNTQLFSADSNGNLAGTSGLTIGAIGIFGMPTVNGYLTNTPPGSPSNGDTYIIGAAPTGAWAGNGGKVTRYSSSLAAWEFFTPVNGWLFESRTNRESYRYTGSAWEIFYQEGTWTPTWSNLTVVGTLVTSGKYIKSGSSLAISVTVSATSTTSNGTGTSFSLPFAASQNGVIGAVDLGNNASYGNGAIVSGGLLAYTPAWTTRPSVTCAGILII